MRAEYLFDMAALCHCPPPVADGMRFLDWALLVTGIDKARADAKAMEAANAPG